MGGCWRPFVRPEGKRATASEDDKEEVDEAASKCECQEERARGRLTCFLDDGCEIERQGNSTVHDGCHYDPVLTDHEKPADQQCRKTEKKSY